MVYCVLFRVVVRGKLSCVCILRGKVVREGERSEGWLSVLWGGVFILESKR